MTDKQINQIRGTSKFLREVFSEDILTVASIVDAEANVITGIDISKNLSILIEGLNAVLEGCSYMINELNKIKENL